MTEEKLISAIQFCKSHNLESSFFSSLQQYELVEITTVQETSYFSADQLPRVEKMARLYSELGINMEGIDAIQHLLERVEKLQFEITQLRNRLGTYENGE